MPDIIQKITIFADEYDMLPDTGLVIVCVSGGADSMCLLETMLEISRVRGFTVGAAHFNHRLRGEESDRDESFVRAFCSMHGIPFYNGGSDVRVYAKEQSLGIEEASRALRYGFFHETALRTGAVRIATAHTADDNAETMIFNLVRGAGVVGLAGIPPVRGMVIRPMLRVSRQDVLSFLSGSDVHYVSDSTNELTIYNRNKIRHSVIPVLREINPGLGEATVATAALLRADELYLSAVADEFIRGHCTATAAGSSAVIDAQPAGGNNEPDPERRDCLSVGADDILSLPAAISGRVIRKLYGGNLSYGHVKAVLEFCERGGASGRLSLPGMTVCMEYGRLVFGIRQRPSEEGFEPIHIETGDFCGCLTIPGAGLNISCKSIIYDGTINKSFTSFLFKSIDICGKMTVRSRREGDTIRLIGRNCTKSLKKLFIEERVPRDIRPLVPVIADDTGVLAVYKLGVSDRAVPKPGDRAFLIDFYKENEGY